MSIYITKDTVYLKMSTGIQIRLFSPTLVLYVMFKLHCLMLDRKASTAVRVGDTCLHFMKLWLRSRLGQPVYRV